MSIHDIILYLKLYVRTFLFLLYLESTEMLSYAFPLWVSEDMLRNKTLPDFRHIKLIMADCSRSKFTNPKRHIYTP